jgi:type IV pilus assembly protein PilM
MAKTGVRVGIDLQQSSVAGVQTKGQTLTHVNVRAMPEGLVFEGEVLNAELLAAELKSFWKESGFTGRRCSLGVANQKVVVRTMEFPLIDAKELRAAIEFQAQEAIPIPLQDAILDYQVLSMVPATEDDGGRQRVLIVAAQRDMILQFTEVAKKAGLVLDGIDLQAFALMRSVAPRVAFVDQGAMGADGAALVNIGSGLTDLVVAVGGQPQFTRVVNLGYETLVRALIDDRGVELPEAEVLRIYVGLSGPDQAVGEYEPSTVAEVHEVLDAACEAFADEISRSIDYYHSQDNEGQVSQVLVSGEGALTRNICGYLSRTLHLPVELGRPLQYVTENKTKVPDPDLQAMSPRLAVAVGLALDDED